MYENYYKSTTRPKSLSLHRSLLSSDSRIQLVKIIVSGNQMGPKLEKPFLFIFFLNIYTGKLVKSQLMGKKNCNLTEDYLT
jgi:hypothetical protein